MANSLDASRILRLLILREITTAQTKNIPDSPEFNKKIQEGVTQLAKIGEIARKKYPNDPTLLSALRTSVEKGEAVKYKIRMPSRGSGRGKTQPPPIDLHKKLTNIDVELGAPLGIIPQMILNHEKKIGEKLTKTQRANMTKDLYFLYITSTIKQIEASTK